MAMLGGSGSDLWASRREDARKRVEPLAVRMRPRTLAEFVGQRHILGVDDAGRPRLLRRMIDADAVMSLILSGPPGTGKTTLAEVIAGATKRRFVRENAASVGVKRIREIIDEAAAILGEGGVGGGTGGGGGKRTILFLDEIHRFTRSQQDVLLGDVERGLITLIGATTENPLFAVNSALISRSTLFRLEPLSEDEIFEVLRAAVADRERGYGTLDITLTESAARVWAIKSEGDARRALTALEVAVESGRKAATDRRDADGPERRGGGAPESDLVRVRADRGSDRALPGSAGDLGDKPGGAPSILIDEDLAEASIQEKVAVYGDDGHYDAASAMIKSVRGCDPDAAVYWIARMLDAGEDPRFIARRLAILASEDVGNADPRGVMVAQSCWDLVERIGMPEARITLSQCATYLSLAPKSNAAYLAIETAMAEVKEGRVLPVPLQLRDPNSSPVSGGGAGGNESGAAVRHRDRRGAGGDRYHYSHGSEHRAEAGGVTGESYLGVDRRYYEPGEAGEEGAMRRRLEEVRRLRARLRRPREGDGGFDGQGGRG